MTTVVTTKNAVRELVPVVRERLADLPGRAPPAIGDDVCRHGGAELSVALINILNSALALIAAW